MVIGTSKEHGVLCIKIVVSSVFIIGHSFVECTT